MSTSSAIAMLLALALGACGGNPPKPVLPDGLHRVPVNGAACVSPVSVASQALPASPVLLTPPPASCASSTRGDRS